MDKEVIENLLIALGTKHAGVSGTWHRAQCPLSVWTHKNGRDRNPSFGIKVEEGEPLRFHCFTCETGSIDTLFQTIEMFESANPGTFSGSLIKAREIVDSIGISLPILKAYSEFDEEKKRKFEELPAYFLETFIPALESHRAVSYLVNKRGLTNEEILKFEICYDPDKDMVVFPYRDVFGRLAGLRGRRVQFAWENAYGNSHHDYVVNGVNNSGLVFYNEQVLNLEGPVVLVEGQVDCIKVCRVWPKTIANLTAKPISEKLVKLAQTEGVVLLLDGDKTGRAGTQKFTEALIKMGVNVLPLYLPFDEYNDVKTDPDGFGEEEIRKLFILNGMLDKLGNML